ncbi:hypothetical protein IFM89_003208 [Coptis chinensis]|uniref:Protein YIP n=1 Tax=Coptis chinensis TaxID=261450 RepID=A0A835H3W1_9MAGN|nr:hypothetical protein IFM89_003208 [Coptis chinensis]
MWKKPIMDDSSSLSYTSLPTSHLLGSVPAVISEDKKAYETSVPEERLEIFPPNHGDRGRGYQSLGSYNGVDEQPATSNWKGVFSISSYTEYFDVDTDVVLDRIKSSLYPVNGDFFGKISNSPDLRNLMVSFLWETFCTGTVWNDMDINIIGLCDCCPWKLCHLISKRSDNSTSWSFDVSYLNVAACAVYGYSILVPTAFYFLLQYFGTSASLVRLWCMWGYSLFIFIPSAFLLLIPVEFLRWAIIIITGSALASFVALNVKSCIVGSDLMLLLVASFVLQIALALFIKIWFFP